MISKNIILTCFLLCFSQCMLIAQQHDKKMFRKATKQAWNYFEDGAYGKAATAYKKILANYPKRAYSYQYLNAAISFAELKNEKETVFYLNNLAEVASRSEMEQAKSASVLQEFHAEKWWKDLMNAFDQRLEGLINHHKTLTIFNQNRKFAYSAIRISAKKDTLANTKIYLVPDGTGWGNQAASQSQILCHYNFSKQDSLDHISEVKEIVTPDFWLRVDTTGIIENEEEIWMHPFRYNEFFKTELAPFPLVRFPISHESMVDRRSEIVIMKNWGTYSPTITAQKYFYEGTEQKKYAFSGDIKCHKFMAYGHNSVHGISHLEYYFHEEYGFTEMNYLTYDNEIIQFKIEKIVSVNKK